jgi:DNA-binding IclR family transcriptional regulator
MTPDRRELLRHLAELNPRVPQSASAIAAACGMGRAEAARLLAGHETVGLVEIVATRGRGWRLTPKGRDHVETRIAHG